MRRLALFIVSLILFGLVFILFYDFLPDSRTGFFALGSFIFTISLMTFSVFLLIFRRRDKKIKTLENRLAAWNNISYHVKRAGDEAFNELPVGIVVFDDSFVIRWGNKYAKNLFQNKLVERSLAALHAELQQLILQGQVRMTITVYDKRYDVWLNKDHHLLYFFDVTEREEVKNAYKARRPSIGVIYLDNLEESLNHYDVQEKSNIRGEYLGVVSDWVSDYQGFLKSYSEDRLVMMIDYGKLQDMIGDRFDILNQIRAISAKHRIRVTVSIGVACWDVSFEELGSYAQNAADLAEKRGGDQVVVNIQGEKIQYFGGKIDASEKSSRVQARVMSQTLRDLIESSDNVVILGHEQGDVDAFGALIGIWRMVRSSEIPVVMVGESKLFDHTVKKMFALLEKEEPNVIKAFVSEKEAVKRIHDNTLVIAVDTQSPTLIASPEVLHAAKRLAVIDHHRRGETTFEAEYTYIEPYASSSVELVVEMMNFYQKPIELTPLEATIMLGGLIVDTNEFTYRTGTRTFEVAATLKDYGADTVRVRTMLREDLERTLEVNHLSSLAEVISKKYAISRAFDDVTMSDRVILAMAAEQLLKIENIEASFCIGRLSANTVGVSARSYGEVNVQIIMEELGGGGHLNSAAAQIENVTTEEARVQLMDILQRDSKEGGETMKVILQEDIKGRGKKGDLIDVANGYGNFLISNKKAIEGSNENIKAMNDALEKAKEEQLRQLNLMKKLKSDIEAKSIDIPINVGHDGKLFGSVTSKLIAESFEKQTGIRIDKKKLNLESEINSPGIYTASVQLHKDVIAQIEIHVIEK